MGQLIRSTVFRRYTGKALNGNDWNFNVDKLVDVLTSGNYDANFSILTATELIGDISQCTGFPIQDLSIVAGTTITAGKIIRQSGSQAQLGDNSSDAGVTNIIGMATTAGGSGDTITVRSYGIVSGLSGLSQGTTYFLSTSGDLTSSAPSSRAKIMGYAISATEFYLLPFTSPTAYFPYIKAGNSVFGTGVAKAWQSQYEFIEVTPGAAISGDTTIKGFWANLYDTGTKKYMEGTSKYAGRFYFDVSTGSWILQNTASAGNADGTATLSTPLTIDKSGGIYTVDWTAWSPTVTSAAGSISNTTYTRCFYKNLGDLVFFSGRIGFDLSTTASTAIYLTLPVAMQNALSGGTYWGFFVKTDSSVVGSKWVADRVGGVDVLAFFGGNNGTDTWATGSGRQIEVTGFYQIV